MTLRWVITAVCFLCLPGLQFTSAASESAPQRSWTTGVSDETTAKKQITALPADPLEGIWSATADGAVIAVVSGDVPGAERTLAERLLLVIIRSPRPGIAPGTVMGWCTPAAKSGSYNARLFTRCDGVTLSAPKRFTLQLTDDSHLSITRTRGKLSVEFLPWNIIPYMFRSAVRIRRQESESTDGLLRRWPADSSRPQRPRYL